MLIAKQILNEWGDAFHGFTYLSPFSYTWHAITGSAHYGYINKQREELKYYLKLSLHHKWELNDFKNVFKHIFLYIYIYIY